MSGAFPPPSIEPSKQSRTRAANQYPIKYSSPDCQLAVCLPRGRGPTARRSRSAGALPAAPLYIYAPRAPPHALALVYSYKRNAGSAHTHLLLCFARPLAVPAPVSSSLSITHTIFVSAAQDRREPWWFSPARPRPITSRS